MLETVRKLPLMMILVVLSAGLAIPLAQAQTTASSADLDSQIESVRADIRSDKVAIITDTMKFTPQESTVFWPIYRKYEADLTQLNDERVKLIKEYADKYVTLTDADAKQMTQQSIDLESRRVDLKKRYFKEFNQKISGVTCAKFFQLEHRLDLLIDLKIASELPMLLIKPVPAATTGSPSQ